MNVTWTERDLRILKENYKTLSDRKIAQLINKTKDAVTKKRQRMGLSK